MATLDIGESMCLNEYCTAELLPTDLSIGLNWQTVPQGQMQVQLGCALLTAQWECVDSVTPEQEQTACASVKRGGEEQRDRGGDKDAQMIHITLASVPEAVTFICCYITSVDATVKLGNGVSCEGKLLDKATERVLSVFTVRDKKQMDNYPAMHMCFFFKLEDRWYFQVAGMGAAGVSPELIADHAKKFLMDKRAPQRRMQINSNNAKLIKRYEHSSKQSSKHTTPRYTPR